MTTTSETVDGIEAKPEPSSLRLILTLGFAGLLSGLALVGTYEATLPTIKHNQAEDLRKAVFKVVPGAVKMQKYAIKDGKLVPAETDPNPPVIAGYDAAGNFKGFGIVGSGNGFADVIKLIYGYDPARKRIIGLQVLESLETPGLGDKIIKDQHFVGCFSDLAVTPDIVATKKGKSQPNEIDAITGATISSKAVVKIINTANQQWLSKLPAAAKSTAAKAPSGGSK